MIELPRDPALNVESFCRMVDPDYLTNSYKLYWLIAIFEEIKNKNKQIAFKRLVCRMVAESWYTLLQYKLNFGAQDKLNDLVLFIHKRFNIKTTENKAELVEFLEEIKNDKQLMQGMSILYRFVPYRLQTPFFESELKGVKDSLKNKTIVIYAAKDPSCFYSINDKEKTITINDCWYDYIYKNQIIINGWLKYKLIDFLQRRNPNVPAIPFKLSAPHKRNLGKAKMFWSKVINLADIRDIYTQKPFINASFDLYGELSIDHFIPWSFVLHDELWNLVPTFCKINSSKSDNLPNLVQYLDLFCEMQFLAFSTAIEKNIEVKSLSDYLTVDKTLSFNTGVLKATFVNSLKSTITPLYQIANNQGFSEWHR